VIETRKKKRRKEAYADVGGIAPVPREIFDK
jgi:hypothetical protein